MRGGVVRRTGDRVGDALDMRTRRVGVDGFVVESLRTGERSVVASLRTGERSILLLFPAWFLFFFAQGCPLRTVFGQPLCVSVVS